MPPRELAPPVPAVPTRPSARRQFIVSGCVGHALLFQTDQRVIGIFDRGLCHPLKLEFAAFVFDIRFFPTVVEDRLSRPTIVLAPPDDEGVLFEPLIITTADAALIFWTTEVEIGRMVARGHLDVVRLGPRKPTSSSRPRASGATSACACWQCVRRGLSRPARRHTCVRNYQGVLPRGAEPTAAIDEGAFISRRVRPADARPKPRRAAGKLVHDEAYGEVREGAHGEPRASAAPRRRRDGGEVLPSR